MCTSLCTIFSEFDSHLVSHVWICIKRGWVNDYLKIIGNFHSSQNNLSLSHQSYGPCNRNSPNNSWICRRKTSMSTAREWKIGSCKEGKNAKLAKKLNNSLYFRKIAYFVYFLPPWCFLRVQIVDNITNSHWRNISIIDFSIKLLSPGLLLK